MGEMDKSRKLYSREGDNINSSRFEGKTVSWEHTIRPYMINRIRGLKQHTLQVNGRALFHLRGIRRTVRNGEQAKNSK